MTEKWKKLIDLICEINKNNFEVFNDNIVYHYFRRFKKDLPFNFEKHIENMKKKKKVDFLRRTDVLWEIFSGFSLETREEVINYLLYKFHQHKASKRRILDLEDFLDSNRDELFGNK